MPAPSNAAPSYSVRHCPSPAPDWELAEEIRCFTFPWEERPVPETRFRALWRDGSLHFRFDCADTELVLAEGSDEKERVLGSDRVEVFIAPDRSLNPYWCLEMDPRGQLLAYQGRHHRQFEWSWPFPRPELRASITDAGYGLEGCLDLSSLPGLGSTFCAGVFRAKFTRSPDGTTRAGWISWVNPQTIRPDFHVPTAFGTFTLEPKSAFDAPRSEGTTIKPLQTQ